MTVPRDPRDGADAAVSGPLARRARPPMRHFTDEEVARILRVASELQERSSVSGGGGARGLTLEDLRQVAAEVGIDARYVELAASEAHGPPAKEESALAGGAYAWSIHRSVDGEVGEADRDRVLRAIRTATGKKGETEDVYGRMEWSHDDGLGPILVGLASRDGVTEIDVSVRRGGEVGFYHALGVPMLGLLGGAAIGSGLLGLSGAEILPVMGGTALASWGGLRFLWSHLSRRWEAKVNRLADAVTRAAGDVAVPPSGGAPAGRDEPVDDG